MYIQKSVAGFFLNITINMMMAFSVAKVQFGPVLQGIFLNREPELNGRGMTGRTKNRTC
jgi:hypothetical protein